jgi:hypothetical protein
MSAPAARTLFFELSRHLHGLRIFRLNLRHRRHYRRSWHTVCLQLAWAAGAGAFGSLPSLHKSPL